MLNENGLCNYYTYAATPGIKMPATFASAKYGYLDDSSIKESLLQFRSNTTCNVTFSLPQIHCASCIYLLEHLHKIDKGIISSRTNFEQKTIFISFDPRLTSLRKVVETLAFTGYEPHISLRHAVDNKTVNKTKSNHKNIRNLGIAGFGFANIMMLSFPDYFSTGRLDSGLQQTFTWLCFLLSLPVLLTGGATFFTAAYKSVRRGVINIDTPIALAIIVTFSRSYFEIITGTGTGYLDSGTGIIFFMLIGRWFQDKTYASLVFDRDHLSYFPMGVTVVKDGAETNVPALKLRVGERVVVRNGEMVPADATLLKGNCSMDYSFISGEQAPVTKYAGELVYAGGKQLGGAIELEVKKLPSQSYITELWNNTNTGRNKKGTESFIHPWSRYFTMSLFAVAICTAISWWIIDPSEIVPSVTAVLIVACPCSLLLSATFAFGNMQRMLGKKHLYLKNAGVIEMLAKAGTIVFDKTGTLTDPSAVCVDYHGTPLTGLEIGMIKKLCSYSAHPLSIQIAAAYAQNETDAPTPRDFCESTGLGISGSFHGISVRLGSALMMGMAEDTAEKNGSSVYVMIGGIIKGSFQIKNLYRPGIGSMLEELQQSGYELHVLSGDNDKERETVNRLFNNNVTVRFFQSPQDKTDYIHQLQSAGKHVLMAGDGLNDAGALLAADTSLAVNNNSAIFTPACDGIINGPAITQLHQLLRYAKTGQKIISATFVLSILYNIVGLTFAVTAHLSPLVAAILMPLSSISIVLFVTMATRLTAGSLRN